MRVLLAHPPLNASREVTPPLGLCTLSAWLRQQGHQVRILDLDLEVKGLPDGQDIYLKTQELRKRRDFLVFFDTHPDTLTTCIFNVGYERWRQDWEQPPASHHNRRSSHRSASKKDERSDGSRQIRICCQLHGF